MKPVIILAALLLPLLMACAAERAECGFPVGGCEKPERRRIYLLRGHPEAGGHPGTGDHFYPLPDCYSLPDFYPLPDARTATGAHLYSLSDLHAGSYTHGHPL